MVEAAKAHGRIARLDGLRACAILAVFLTHAFKIRMLWIGVDLFFVLSGFLITGILVDLKHKDIKGYFSHFYERRVRRIAPPYILLLIVVGLFFGWAWLRHWYMLFGLTNYLLIFPGEQFMPFNPLWSLGVEEQFYLVWPLVIYFVSEKKLPYVAGSLLIVAPILRVLEVPFDTGGHWLVYMGTPFRMDCLAMGALLTFMWRQHGEKIRQYGYLGLIAVVMCPIIMIPLSKLGGFSTLDGTYRSNSVTYEVALSAATGAFLWGLGGRYTGILTTRVFQFLGRISYSFYLIHLSTILFFQRYFSSKGKVGAFAFVTSVVYATLSWYLLEKPILAGGSRRTAKIELAAAETAATAEGV